MARKTIAERIAQLDARKKALQARAGKQERANDTRRKVLLGALVLHRIENDREFGGTLRDFVKRELPGFLTREADKALFADFLADGKSSASAAPSSPTKIEPAPPASSATPMPASQPPKSAVEALGRRVNEDI